MELLVAHFIEEINREQSKDVEGLDNEALALLKAHTWPGNVRELRNAIERAVITRERGRIALHDLLEEIYEVRHSEDQFVVRVGSTLESVEHELIRRTLEATVTTAVALPTCSAYGGGGLRPASQERLPAARAEVQPI